MIAAKYLQKFMFLAHSSILFRGCLKLAKKQSFRNLKKSKKPALNTARKSKELNHRTNISEWLD